MTALASHLPRPGCLHTEFGTSFCLFSPRAARVDIEIWPTPDSEHGKRHAMTLDDHGYWHFSTHQNLTGKWYAYHIIPPDPCPPDFEPYEGPVADPWSTHVATRNTYQLEARSLIEAEDAYDWEGDKPVSAKFARDLIIYEAHLRDFTAHETSDATDKGTYAGFLEAKKRGGIPYLKELGINAVQFLPLQSATRYEPEYMETTIAGVTNTWNLYGYNHWGYMTAFFFVPETMYASGEDGSAGALIGTDTRARNEFRDVIKALHRENISVFMDVVYNHVSNYNLNPLKKADKAAYFRLDENGNYRSESGCGNDSRTEHPEFRRLIVESVKYWMQTYHIDGFRFDLAHLIDWETIDAITKAAREINPKVVLIAEPWGGGYDPTGFSARGWIAWNDQIRNGVKGFDPVHGKGFIFGNWIHDNHKRSVENYLCGTLLGSSNGRFVTSATSLNYLESHDGYTLADFIRIGLDARKQHEAVHRENEIPLSETAGMVSRLAALSLFVSQGVTMIHQGQEFGRMKRIAENDRNDPQTGQLDHNSYEKDNPTNYIDYDEVEANKDLLRYYRGLIAIRKNAPALRLSPPEALYFKEHPDPLFVVVEIKGEQSADPYNYFVALNGNILLEHELTLPDGFWEVLAGPTEAREKALAKVSGKVVIAPTTGILLRKKR